MIDEIGLRLHNLEYVCKRKWGKEIMPINKNALKAALTSKGNFICHDIASVALDLNTTLADTEMLVGACVNRQAIPFILWNDFFNQSGTLAPKNGKRQYRYKWGDKVFVDFGCANIQTEISFPHPAIVLYNFSNTVIVAPTTSDDNPTFSDDIESVIIKVEKDGRIFPKDTVINLHQIKAVHKERIISNLKCNVRDYTVGSSEIQRLNRVEQKPIFSDGIDLLTCIRIKLAAMFASQYVQSILAENEAANEKVKAQAEQLVEKDAEIARLQAKLDALMKDSGNKG